MSPFPTNMAVVMIVSVALIYIHLSASVHLTCVRVLDTILDSVKKKKKLHTKEYLTKRGIKLNEHRN